jgi:hypothetical protein
MPSTGYPDPSDVTVNGSTFHLENIGQGGGDHGGTIQIKALKKGTQGSLYNTTALHATKIVVDELDTSSSSYAYTGALTAYAGSAANPTENETTTKLEKETVEGVARYHCVYTFNTAFDYFRLAASSNAVYAISIAFYA